MLYCRNTAWNLTSPDNTHDHTVEHPVSRSMDHSIYASGVRKLQYRLKDEHINQPQIYSAREPHQQIYQDVISKDMTPSRPAGEVESRSHSRPITKNHYRELFHPLPSSPQEESSMTVLPSFSTLSNFVDNSARNRRYIRDQNSSFKESNIVGSRPSNIN